MESCCLPFTFSGNPEIAYTQQARMQRKKPHTSLKRIFWRFAISALKSEHSDGVDLNESALRNVVAAERDAGRLHGADEGLRIHVVDLVESSTFFM